MRVRSARKLSVARDGQATIDAFLDATEESAGRPVVFSPRSITTIQARLETLRTTNETAFWNAEMRQEMSDYLTEASAQVAQWDLSKLTFSELADMLAKTYRRAGGSIPKSWDQTEAEDLHELRRRVVEHRYQMELIEPAWPRLRRIWVDEAQRLRTRLGKYQDLAVLIEKTGPHQVLAPWQVETGASHRASANRACPGGAEDGGANFCGAPKGVPPPHRGAVGCAGGRSRELTRQEDRSGGKRIESRAASVTFTPWTPFRLLISTRLRAVLPVSPSARR